MVVFDAAPPLSEKRFSVRPARKSANRPSLRARDDRFHFSRAGVRAFPPSSVNMWCIVGCDPDVGGALAVITGQDVRSVDTVSIFDCPTKPVDVRGKARTRVCVDGMVALVRKLDLPPGTVASGSSGRSR